MSFKKDDLVVVDTSGWSAQKRQKAKIIRCGAESIGIIWETGELAGKEANIARAHFRVLMVMKKKDDLIEEPTKEEGR